MSAGRNLITVFHSVNKCAKFFSGDREACVTCVALVESVAASRATVRSTPRNLYATLKVKRCVAFKASVFFVDRWRVARLRNSAKPTWLNFRHSTLSRSTRRANRVSHCTRRSAPNLRGNFGHPSTPATPAQSVTATKKPASSPPRASMKPTDIGFHLVVAQCSSSSSSSA